MYVVIILVILVIIYVLINVSTKEQQVIMTFNYSITCYTDDIEYQLALDQGMLTEVIKNDYVRCYTTDSEVYAAYLHAVKVNSKAITKQYTNRYKI